ncbi:hypothetical protein BpHYR1_044123 [Brachionus plicatilis]|uniref:Uncharacterized protein n=1 Tax=Brachionus plicatilis TaxID=10195 RepID=A0A3M7SWG4_BRAPC|nr:hypothetical protein BpHYR1_044123 [Brachionus plicatilis]
MVYKVARTLFQLNRKKNIYETNEKNTEAQALSFFFECNTEFRYYDTWVLPLAMVPYHICEKKFALLFEHENPFSFVKKKLPLLNQVKQLGNSHNLSKEDT